VVTLGRPHSIGSLSPLNADLHGLPPLLIEAGECEILRDQIVAMATKAAAAGVDARLTVSEDMVHVFQLLRFAARSSKCPAPKASMRRIAAFILERAGTPTAVPTGPTAEADAAAEVAVGAAAGAAAGAVVGAVVGAGVGVGVGVGVGAVLGAGAGAGAGAGVSSVAVRIHSGDTIE
jgi:hypothetical protein